MKSLITIMLLTAAMLTACKDETGIVPLFDNGGPTDPLITALRLKKDFPSFNMQNPADGERLRKHDEAILARWSQKPVENGTTTAVTVSAPEGAVWYVWDDTLPRPGAAVLPRDSNLVPKKIVDDPGIEPSNWTNGWALERFSRVSHLETRLVLIGLSIGSNNDNWTAAYHNAKAITSDGTLSPNQYTYGQLDSQRYINLAIGYTFGATYADTASRGALSRVLIGFGARYHNGIRTVRGYYAPYNPATGRIEIHDVNDVIVLSNYEVSREGGPKSAAVEHLIRTFDIVQNKEQLSRMFVKGFGGRTHKGNISRVALLVQSLYVN